MDKLLPVQMLDRVLEWFAMIDIDEMGKGEQVQLRVNVLKQDALRLIKNNFIELKTLEFSLYENLILDKLVRDKYLIEENGYYSITFEGKLFNERGRYEGEYKSLDVKRKWELHLEEQSLKNAGRLNWLTGLLSIGTIGLLLFEICKFYLERHC